MSRRSSARRAGATAPVALWLACVVLLGTAGGCLDDDRCGPGQRRAGARCLPVLDGGTGDLAFTDSAPPADAAPPKDTAPPNDGLSAADRTPTGEGHTATCALSPTPEQLVGRFAMQGTVQQSTCTAPLPTKGATTTAEVTFTEDGGALKARFTLLGLSTDGAARIETDGRVVVTAAGNLLGMDFTAQATLCFASTASGSYAAKIDLANTSGPLCALSSTGAFTRQ